MRDVTIVKIDANPIEDIDANDLVDSKRGDEESLQRCPACLPVSGCRFRKRRGYRAWTTAIECVHWSIKFGLDHSAGWNQMSQDGLPNRNGYVVEQACAAKTR